MDGAGCRFLDSDTAARSVARDGALSASPLLRSAAYSGSALLSIGFPTVVFDPPRAIMSPKPRHTVGDIGSVLKQPDVRHE